MYEEQLCKLHPLLFMGGLWGRLSLEKPSEEYQAKPSLGDYFLKGKFDEILGWSELGKLPLWTLGEIDEATCSFFPCWKFGEI